jgi:hypothetical protein
MCFMEHRVLLQKLLVAQLFKKFPVSNVTQRFITMFTRVRHLSQTSAR